MVAGCSLEAAALLRGLLALATTMRVTVTSSRELYYWHWDITCKLQPKIGPCLATASRWYYDIAADRCLPFTYGGCHGNRNRFLYKQDCQRFCTGNSGTTVERQESGVGCTLQPDSGYCLAYIPTWYYNVNERSCKIFIWGGCGGNQNRFDTKSACAAHCRSVRLLQAAPEGTDASSGGRGAGDRHEEELSTGSSSEQTTQDSSEQINTATETELAERI